MARPSKAQLKARKREARAAQRHFHAVHREREQKYQILLEEPGAARVVCLKCGLEQPYTASGSSDPPGFAPCPWCGHGLCETVEAYNEETPPYAPAIGL